MIKRAGQPERDTDRASACIEDKSRECQLVDFVGSDGRCHSFPLAQLVQCVLERNPASQDQADSAPERLTIVFPTQDVVILGWNLKALRDALDLGKLVTVRTRDARYGGVEDKQPFVTGISVNAQS
jgi:hypothetical protein